MPKFPRKSYNLRNILCQFLIDSRQVTLRPTQYYLRGLPPFGSDPILGNLHVSVIVSKHPQVHHIIFSSVYAQRLEGEDVLHFYFYLPFFPTWIFNEDALICAKGTPDFRKRVANMTSLLPRMEFCHPQGEKLRLDSGLIYENKVVLVGSRNHCGIFPWIGGIFISLNDGDDRNNDAKLHYENTNIGNVNGFLRIFRLELYKRCTHEWLI